MFRKILLNSEKSLETLIPKIPKNIFRKQISRMLVLKFILMIRRKFLKFFFILITQATSSSLFFVFLFFFDPSLPITFNEG